MEVLHVYQVKIGYVFTSLEVIPFEGFFFRETALCLDFGKVLWSYSFDLRCLTPFRNVFRICVGWVGKCNLGQGLFFPHRNHPHIYCNGKLHFCHCKNQSALVFLKERPKCCFSIFRESGLENLAQISVVAAFYDFPETVIRKPPSVKSQWIWGFHFSGPLKVWGMQTKPGIKFLIRWSDRKA